MSGIDNYATGEWIGFLDGDVTAVIDLGASNGNAAGKTVAELPEIKHVSTHAVIDMGAWVAGCTGLAVSVSDDKQKLP